MGIHTQNKIVENFIKQPDALDLLVSQYQAGQSEREKLEFVAALAAYAVMLQQLRDFDSGEMMRRI